jgi:hypothetical protein
MLFCLPLKSDQTDQCRHVALLTSHHQSRAANLGGLRLRRNDQS